LSPENAEYAETASLAKIKTVLWTVVVVEPAETSAGLAAAFTTTGTDTFLATVYLRISTAIRIYSSEA
jgi:hypothetical protein